MYSYGEEVDYNFLLLSVDDKEKLQKFDCGNTRLNKFIREEIIPKNIVLNEDGLIFKAEDNATGEIIAIISLAASSIIFTQTNYMKLLPGIKIDVFAVDIQYQKMHFDEKSKNELNPNLHYYLSDDIMVQVINHCHIISKEYALVKYILLYADKEALRFYERNLFKKFDAFMVKGKNAEINKNIPMYMKI